MRKITKPMKAPSESLTLETLKTLSYPKLLSPKLDGIRSVFNEGQSRSSTLKLIPNDYTRSILQSFLPEGADGELISGTTFQDCTSAFMSKEGRPNFQYWMFDLSPDITVPYTERLAAYWSWYCAQPILVRKFVIPVPQLPVRNVEEVLRLEAQYLKGGYEGVMLRSLDAPYKCGRSTLKQQYLLKLKRFKDSEAEVIGFEEQMENTNTLTKDELGHAKRSSHKSGKKGKGTLGKFIARDVHGRFPGVDLRIGTGKGLTKKLRQTIWDNRKAFLSSIVKYKYQEIGSVDAPRLPIYLGFRDKEDM